MNTQNLKTLTLEAIALANVAAVKCCGNFNKDVLMTGVSNATPNKENINVFDIDASNIISNVDGQDLPTKIIDWCWSTFGSISYSPLICDDLKRNIPLSNVGYHAESIQEIRYALMVKDKKKMIPFSDLDKLNTSQIQIKDVEDFLSRSLTDQLEYSASIYYNMIIVCLTVCQKVAGIQIQLYKDSDIRLIVWGGFKKMKK